MPVATVEDRPFILAGRRFRSRLIIGTGKYKNYAENAAALEASGAEIVTVALRRVNVMDARDVTAAELIQRGERVCRGLGRQF